MSALLEKTARSLEGDLNALKAQGRIVSWPINVEAEIHYLLPSEGGRPRPVFSGYRGQFFYDGRDWMAQQEFPDVQRVEPGQTVRALISLIHPADHEGRLYPGKEFEIREGPHMVGRGRITEIFGWS